MTVDPAPQDRVPAEARQPDPNGPDEPAAAEYPHDAPVLLEEDETVPPRPEEEAADLLRAEPDPH